MNTRRGLLAAGAAWPVLAWTGALRAQAKAPVVIGWLDTVSRERHSWATKAFHEGMAALGWKLGVHYVLEERYADGRTERLPELAQDIAATRPAVIVAGSSDSARAAAAAAPTTPVVLCNGAPLLSGLVTNLARPGGLITGVSNAVFETRLKVIELLVETMPTLRRVGFLVDATSPLHSAIATAPRQAAEHFRVEPIIADMAKPEDLEPAMARLAKADAQALAILPYPWFSDHVRAIVASALARRWPAVGAQPAIARSGGLFSFGHNAPAAVRRSAYYVDRILKGARPGDLPIEQPTIFDLVLNLKTAQQLGIVIPRSMMIRATELIE